MRIRSIKPEFWRSEDVAALSWEARLIFIGMWSYVDDNGVGRDSAKAITADLFGVEDDSRDPRETLATVSRGLQALCDRGLLVRYKARADDRDRELIFVTGWDRHQRVDRPNKPRYPRPPAMSQDPARPSRDPREDASNPRETLATGTGEQGNRGTGSTGSVTNSTHQRASGVRDEDHQRVVSIRQRSKATRHCSRHLDVALDVMGQCIECVTAKLAGVSS